MAHAPTPNASLANQLWDKAWGKPWPHQSSGKVSIAEMVSTDNDPSMLIEFDEDDDSVISTPTDWEYNCLHRIHEVVKACLALWAIMPWIRDFMMNRR